MKIWIDGYEANVPQRLGSSQIAFELLKSLEKIDKKNEYIIFLPNRPMEDLPKERPGWCYRIIKINSFKTWLALPLALYTTKEKPGIFFSPTHYSPGFSPVKKISMIFDLAFLRFPNMFKKRDLWQMKLWTKLAVNSAAKIITISKATKTDIIKFYGTKNDKIEVAYPGFDSKVFHPVKDKEKINSVQKKYGISGEYIIYIGTIQPRKNLIRLVEAFAKVSLDSPDLRLVIVGKTTGLGRQAWMFEDTLKKPKELGIEDKVIFTGFAPTEDLPYLISGAEVFILLSLWEGFGIPVVESMACGTPVIVSNISSLPEVAGKAGIMIDPNSVDQIEHAIRAIVFDKKIRAEKSKEAIVQASKFSWDKMGREVLKTFQEVAEEIQNSKIKNRN